MDTLWANLTSGSMVFLIRQTLIYAVPLMIVASVPLYNIFSVLVLTVTAPQEKGIERRGVVSRTLGGIITNPIILGILAGLPFSLLSVDFPPMIAKGLDMLAGCATPVEWIMIPWGTMVRPA